MADDDLRQADLSNLMVQDMTPAQKAEMRRRYAEFVETMRSRRLLATKLPPATAKKLQKWVPSAKPKTR
jgi:hypothetical protein